MNFDEIPVIAPLGTPRTEQVIADAPTTIEGPTKYEYEFSNYHRGVLYFVCLWDDNDVSACERVVHRPLTQADITYSNTGNGFVRDGELSYTFKKEVYTRSVTLPDIKAGVTLETRGIPAESAGKTAADILASL